MAASAADWKTTRDTLIEEYLKAQPAFAVYQGRHEFDGQLPDWSAEGLAAQIKWLHGARDRALRGRTAAAGQGGRSLPRAGNTRADRVRIRPRCG